VTITDTEWESESAGETLARLGTDGAAWAAEFVRIAHKHHPEILDPAPGGWLHGWFCNAIEAGVSSGYGQGRRVREPGWPLDIADEREDDE
jgi:hypothetical protein